MVKQGVLERVKENKLLRSPKRFWKKVTSIGECAFTNCKEIEHIEVPEKVISISPRAFTRYKSLKSIKLPDSIETIGNAAFALCSALEEINLPSNLKIVEECCLMSCKKLKKVSIPDSVETIGPSAFMECISLEEVIFSLNLKQICQKAFTGCKNLKSITIPNGVTEIEGSAFSCCSSLEEVVLSDSLKYISPLCFWNCKSLEKIVIPNSVEYIGESAFAKCTSLEEVILPDNLLTIEEAAFLDCYSLKYIKLPKNLETIGNNAFENCDLLEEIIIPNKVKKIGYGAFENCKSLKHVEIPDSVQIIGGSAFFGCEDLEKVIIPPGVKKINSQAFANCKSLKYVEIPDTVESLGDKVFDSNENLKEIIIIKNGKKISVPNSRLIIHNTYCDILKKPEVYKQYLEDNIPSNIIKILDESNQLQLLQTTKMYNRLLKNYNNDNQNATALADLVKIGINLGLFTDEKIIVGKNELKLCDLGYNIIQKFVKGGLQIENMHMYFQSTQINKPNIEFIKFLSNKINIDEIIEEEKKTPGFINKVCEWFNEREQLQISPNLGEGFPTEEKNRYKVQVYETTSTGVDKLRWRSPNVANLKKAFSERKFMGINDENKHIAEELSGYPQYSQKHFDKANEIDKERKALGVPDHLVGHEVKQTIEEAWKEYFDKTEDIKESILTDGAQTIGNQQEIADKIFTYEILSKSDASNFAMGFLTSCCATLYGAGAGAQRAMIVSDNMQPLVIRDSKGNIIAFGIIYVNKEEGYAVVNNFEVSGLYSGKKEQLKLIYDKAMQGVRAFVNAYNSDKTKKPITLVTCGKSPNWDAINEFIGSNPTSNILAAPNFNKFKYAGSGSWPGDWHDGQWIIYNAREEKTKNKEGGKK